MNDERGHWYLLTGVMIGAILGLLYAWVAQPVRYTNTNPASLRADFKDQYRYLIASAYMANGDLVRAKARLGLLQDEDAYRSLAEQAQRTLANGAGFEQARALGMLAAAIQQGSQVEPPAAIGANNPTATQPTPPGLNFPAPSKAASSEESPIPVPTQVENPDSTNQPSLTLEIVPTSITTGTIPATQTPTATPGAPYVLANRQQICDQNQGEGLIQVFTQDAAGQPVPGVEIIVTWQEGEDHFFTGLNPSISVGYADFSMTPGTTYTLHIAGGGQTISDLAASDCENADGSHYWGNWRLEFVQP
jgi:hypothetical protein